MVFVMETAIYMQILTQSHNGQEDRVYQKPLHPDVWILQFQDGVEDDVGVSVGSNVLQGLQHTHHLVKYQMNKSLFTDKQTKKMTT